MPSISTGVGLMFDLQLSKYFSTSKASKASTLVLVCFDFTAQLHHFTVEVTSMSQASKASKASTLVLGYLDFAAQLHHFTVDVPKALDCS